MLHLSEIDWIEAAGNYAQLWIGQRNYFLRESLQLLEERAGKHGFIRAHRRALVRLDGVRELTRTWPAPSSRLGIRRPHPHLPPPRSRLHRSVSRDLWYCERR